MKKTNINLVENKRIINTICLIIIALLFVIAAILPSVFTTVKGEDVAAAQINPITRTSTLNLSSFSSSVTYVSNTGLIKTVNPNSGNITDTAEGWSWYLTAADGYAAYTLLLWGVDIDIAPDNNNINSTNYSGNAQYPYTDQSRTINTMVSQGLVADGWAVFNGMGIIMRGSDESYNAYNTNVVIQDGTVNTINSTNAGLYAGNAYIYGNGTLNISAPEGTALRGGCDSAGYKHMYIGKDPSNTRYNPTVTLSGQAGAYGIGVVEFAGGNINAQSNTYVESQASFGIGTWSQNLIFSGTVNVYASITANGPGNSYALFTFAAGKIVISDTATVIADATAIGSGSGYGAINLNPGNTPRAGAWNTEYVAYGAGAEHYSLSIINGGASFSGNGYYIENATVNIRAGAKDGYVFSDWTSDYSQQIADINSANTTFTMPSANASITANWTPASYSIDYKVNGGTLSGQQNYYTYGNAYTLPTPTWSGNTFQGWYDNAMFTGSAVTEVSVEDFGNKTFWAKWNVAYNTLTSSAGSGGSIFPNGSIIYNGTSQEYIITPNPGYKISTFTVGGVDKTLEISSYTYTVTNISTDTDIIATFELLAAEDIVIYASAGNNGTISPSGFVNVANGGSQTFNFTPYPGYSINDVIVNDISQGFLTSYTFNNVIENQTIRVTYTISCGSTYFASGSGVSGNPYIIETAAQLALLADIINNGEAAKVSQGGAEVPYATLQTAHYKLANDIVLNDETFTFDPDTGLVIMTDGTNTAYLGTGIAGDTSGANTTFDSTASVVGRVYIDMSGIAGAYTGDVNPWFAIGLSPDDVYSFRGNFDGAGFTVSGMYINTTSENQGLFGYTGEGSYITNIGIVNSYVKGDRVGGIVGWNRSGTINNSYNSGIVIAENIHAGGISGQNTGGTIINSYNTGMVIGNSSNVDDAVGGIVGRHTFSGIIANSFNTGTVTGKSSFVGGIVGYNTNTTFIHNCYNVGTVKGYSNNVGAVVGRENTVTVTNCYYLIGSATDGDDTIQFGIGATQGSTTADSSDVTTSFYESAILSSDITIGSYTGTSLLHALNAWVDNEAPSDYSLWEYYIYPVFEKPFFAGGSGVDGDPYIIETASQLALLAEIINSGNEAVVINGGASIPYATLQTAYYKLGNDIILNNETFTFDPDSGLVIMTDGTNIAYLGTGVKGNITFDTTASVMGTIYSNMSGTVGPYAGNVTPWVSIGTNAKEFKGKFDGGGYEISGLYINNSLDYQGLFGATHTGAIISNVGVTNSYIRGNRYIGGIVGLNTDTYIVNCYNKATIMGTGLAIGGIAGRSTSGSGSNITISYCYNDGNIIGIDNLVGGIVGSSAININNSYNTGSVRGNTDVGGIVGVNAVYWDLINIFNTGSVSGTNYHIGGIAGLNRGTISNAYNIGSVRGAENYVGGVAGRQTTGTTTHSYYLTGCAEDGDNVVQFGTGNVTKSSITVDVDGVTTGFYANATFVSDVTISGDNPYTGTSLLDALNAWVDNEATPNDYLNWTNEVYPIYINDWTSPLTISDWTYGETANSPSATSAFGTAVFTYSDSEFGDYTDTVPTNAGVWWVKASVEGSANYTEVESVVSFTISKADYDMSGVTFTNDTVEYDGQAHSIIITGILPTGTDDIQVTVSYSGSATNVAEGDVTVTATFATTSTNYNVPEAMTATITITAKELTVTGTVASNKIYNGNTTGIVSSNGTLNGVESSDSVDFGIISATFADKNVATNKNVTVVYSLSGADEGNYTVANSVVTADITPKELTVTGTVASNKIYNGNTTGTVSSNGTLNGKEGGDAVTFSITSATFANKNVATGINVTVVYSLSGADEGNYTVANSVVTADITPKELTVTGTVASNKIYNGNTTGTVSGNGTLNGVEIGDTVEFSIISATFADKNVATDIDVTVVYLLSEASSSNYTVANSVTTADITPKELTVTGTVANNKLYDDNTTGTVSSNGTLNGVEIGDTVDFGIISATFADKNENAGIDVTVVYSLSGVDKDNYTVANSIVTADIIPNTITFDSNGGSDVSAITEDYNTAISAPTAPTITGYTFAGWFTDNNTFLNEYTFTTMPAESFTLYAAWEINVFDVTFYDYNQTTVLKAKVGYEYGEYPIAPTNPTRATDNSFSYVFLGWTSDGENIYGSHNIPAALSEDADYYAVYTRTYLYELTIGSTVQGSASGNPGDQIVIDYSLDINPGICALHLNYFYDTFSLELVSIEVYDVANPTAAFYGGSAGFNPTPSGNLSVYPYNIAWEDLPNNSGTGYLVEMTFAIKANAAGGLYEIGLGIVENTTTNNEVSSEGSKAYRTYGAEGEFSDVKINYTPREIIIYTDGSLNIDDNQTKIYDGSEVTSGQLFGDIQYDYVGDGVVSVVFYAADGTTVLATPPTNVGTYYIGVSAAQGMYYNAVSEVKQQFKILPATLDISALDIVTANKTYTGSQISWTTGDIVEYPANTTLTSVTGAWTNVGNYNITVRLTANSNYTISGDAEDYYDYSVSVSILQATNDWTTGLSCESVIYGNSPSPFAESIFGDVAYSYSTELEGTYSETMPSANVGTYYVKATVTGTSNYTGLESVVSFSVNPATLIYSGEDIIAADKVYNGDILTWLINDFTAPANTTIHSVTVIDGQDYTNVGTPTITVVLQADSNYTFDRVAGDTLSTTVTLTILRADANIDIDIDIFYYNGIAVFGGDFDYIYTGDGSITFNWYADDDGVMGNSISAPLSAGIYWIGILADQGDNYNAAEEVYERFEILAADNSWVVELSLSGWTYGDEPNTPFAEALFSQSGEPVYTYRLLADEEASFTTTVPDQAGVFLVKASVAVTNDYYAISATVEFTISPAILTYSDSDISCDTMSKVYTGANIIWEAGEFTAPEFTTIHSVEIITGQDYINVGAPTITVYLKADSNHTFEGVAGDVKSFVFTLEITQATNAWVTTISCEDIIYGNSPNPSAVAQFMAIGEPSYVYSATESGDYTSEAPEDVGTYWVKAIIAATANYTGLESDPISFDINKATYDMTGISISNSSVEYDGNEHSILIIGDLPEGVTVDYTNNQQINVGAYLITATFTGDYSNYNNIESITANLTITPLSIATIIALDITPDSKTYTGLELDWLIGDFASPANTTVDSVDKIIGQNYTNAGNPTITVTLLAGGNYTFYGTAGDTKEFTVTLTINQATNVWSTELSCDDISFGGTLNPIAVAAFMDMGEPVYTYSSTQMGTYTSIRPVNLGTYYVKATVEQTNNYTGLVSAPYQFNINAHSFEELTATDITAADKYYTGIELVWIVADFTAPSNTSVQSVAIIELQDYTNAGNPTITVTLLAGSNYTFYGTAGDTKDFIVTLNILQATNEWIVALTCEGIIFGGTLAPSAEAKFMTIDEPAYTYSATEFGTYLSEAPEDVGTYWVKATIAATANYTALSATTQFSIGTLTVTKPVVIGTLVYNSASQSPNIATKATYTITNNTATNAGNYTAIVSLNDKENTTWADSSTDDLELSWDINKAQVTFTATNKSSIYYSLLAAFTYTTTGTVYNDELLPYVTSTVKLTSFVNTYPLIMNCAQDENNNYQILLINGTYTVNPAPITLTADNKTSQYSDSIQPLTYQVTSGELFGSDELNVTLNTSATSLSNVGEYAITIGASNSNYDITLSNGVYTITRKILNQDNIQYNAAAKYYTGSARSWTLADITLTGATFTVITYDDLQDYINAGNYTVTVNATSKANYTFNQDEPADSGDSLNIVVSVEILQATNYWVEELSASNIVFDQSLVINAEARFAAMGGPVYTYSAIIDGEYTATLPTQVGQYYVRATVLETDNYTGLISDAVLFSITILYIEIPYLSGTYTYNGENQTVTENNTADNAYYTTTGTLTAINAGDYNVDYTLDDTINTQWTNETTAAIQLEWTIEKAEVTLIADYKSSSYGADIVELTYTITIGAIYNDDIIPGLSTNATNESNVGNYVIAITASNANYNIDLYDNIYAITRATYDMSEISFDDGYFTYDATEQSIFISGTLPDGVSVTYTGNGQVDARVSGYLVEANFLGNSNYNAITAMTAYIYIDKASITFVADNKNSAYGADIVTLTYATTGNNYDDIVPSLNTVASNESNVGDYSIIISITNPDNYDNYNITLTNATYTITQATNTWLEALVCEDIVYNGALSPSALSKFFAIGEPVFTFSGSESGDYTSEAPVNAGTYWVKATVIETANYTGLVAKVSFNINKATFDLGDISFNGILTWYNGSEQTIAITGELPAGVTVDYVNNALTNVGYTDATAMFTLDDPDNYNAIDDMFARLTINAAPIVLAADNKTSAYSDDIVELTFSVTFGTNYNDEIVPTLSTTATSVSDVGDYVITILATDSNYDITLVNGEYTITQATNYWTTTLIANDNIYGDELDIIVYAYFGTIILYYSTEYDSGFSTNQPTLVNTYYVMAVVEEDANYTGLISDTESFMILKATLALPTLSYVGGTVSWAEVTTTLNGLSVTGVTYTIDGAPNELRSYSATSASNYYTIVAIPEDTDNYLSSSINTFATFTVSFTTEYGIAPSNQYIFDGYKATQPKELTYNTHTLVRWKDSKLNTWIFTINIISKDTTISADWVASTYSITYIDGITDITLDLPEAYDKSYTYGDTLTLIHTTPYNKTGYTFNYWADNGGVQFIEITSTTYGDITVYADWTANQYTIAYYTSYDGGEYVRYDTQYYDFGTLTTPTVTPDAITYFRYDSWFIDEARTTEYIFLTMPAANITVYGAYVWDIGLGDVNGDGFVDADDITLFRQWLVGGYYANIIAAVPDYDGDILLRVADINGDGVFDIRDVSSIRMAIVGGYGYGILDETSGNSVTGEEIARIVEINGNVDINIVPDGATITGTITGDYDATFTGTWVGGSGNYNEFAGTMTGDFSGSFTASVDANGTDTLFAQIDVLGATYPVRLIAAIIPDSGVDYRGYLVTGPEPQYVESLEITALDDNYIVDVGETLQLGVNVLPAGASTDMYWSIYVNDANKASICFETGLVTGMGVGTALVIAKAADGSHVSATKTIIVNNGLVFTLINGDTEYEVARGINTDDEVELPAIYNNKPVTKIADQGFFSSNKATSITSISIPDSITSIGDLAFANTRLTNILLPDSLTHIGMGAFYNSDLQDITISEYVVTIGSGPFFLCSNLSNISVDQDNPNYLSEDGVLFNKDKTELITYPRKKSDTTYTIPETVITLGVGAFNFSNNLISVTLSDSLNTISPYAFAYCINLVSIIIPESVTLIGQYAFLDSGLLTVNIMRSSTSSVIELEIDEYYGNHPFYLTSGSLVIYVLPDSYDSYIASPWNELTIATMPTVTFDTDGGTSLDNVVVLGNSPLAEPEDPTKDGYAFVGWYVEDTFVTPYDFATLLTEDMTIYALFMLSG